MNYLEKLTKFFQTKFYTLCLFFIILFILPAVVIFYVSPPLPESVHIEIKRKQFAPLCERRSCISNWIREYQSDANLTQLDQMCTEYNWSPFTNKTLQLYQEGKVDWEFLQGIYDYVWRRDCNRKCAANGPFLYFASLLRVNLQITQAWVQHELCSPPYTTSDSCRWRGYLIRFQTYFSYFSIPATIILNVINLATLLKLLAKGSGAAVYLHTAEIVTDGLLNLIVGFHNCLLFFAALDFWRTLCGYFQYSLAFQAMSAVQRFVSFVNQAYLIGLLADRLYALTKPVQYNGMSDADRKNNSKNIILKTFLGSFTLYFPFIFFRMFRPIFTHWKTMSSFWKSNLDRIDFTLSTFYIAIDFALLISQIVIGVFVEKKYRKFVKSKLEMTQESQKELKKRERDKQLLLAGTIGLNIMTGLTSASFNTVESIAFNVLLGYSDRPWWIFLFHMADPVLKFMNGNLALVIHIIFVKSYRKALKATWFWKLIFGNQQTQPAQ